MKATEQTIQQIDRALRKTAEKFPASKEAALMTDIHVRVTQESGELLTYDDDDHELTRCVVEQCIDNKDDDFYEQVKKANNSSERVLWIRARTQTGLPRSLTVVLSTEKDK